MNQQEQHLKVSLKIVIGGDCFRLNKLPSSFSELDEIVRKKFENKLPDNFCFKYEDSDNDSINVESTSDYEAFLEYCIQEKLRSIKLRIDSKTFKQYFSCFDQQVQQQLLTGVQQGNSSSSNMQNQQNLQNITQIQQCNNAMGMLVNPYMTLNQNIQRGVKSPVNFQTQSNDSQGQIHRNQGTDQNINQMLMQMLLTQQGVYNNFYSGNIRSQSVQGNNNANNINNNNNYSNFLYNNQNMNTINVNNSNLNNNTNAVNNSVSSQQPLLSKGTSEIQNASEMNFKRQQSVNQSQSGVLDHLNFVSQDKKVLSSVSSSNNNLINNSFAPNIKVSGKNPLNQYFQMQQSQQYNPEQNQNSKFIHQDSATFNQMEKQEITSSNFQMSQNNMEFESIQNPMDGDDKQTSVRDIKSSSKFPTQNQIKRTNSMSGEVKDQPTLSPQQQMSFMPRNQSNTSEQSNTQNNNQGFNLNNNNNLLNNNYIGMTNSQKISKAKTSINLYKQNEFTSSNNSNIDTRIQKDNNLNNQIDGIEYEAPITIVNNQLNPSPPFSNFLTNSTNLLIQPKIQNRPSNISTNRSGQNIQVPCEKCIIWDEEQKNNPTKQQQQEKTPTNNSSKDPPLFTPNPKCNNCDGTGYLKIEDQHQYNVIQTIMRHKLREAELILKSLSVRQQKVEKIIPKDSMDQIQSILNACDLNNELKQTETFSPDIHKINQESNEQNKTEKPKTQNTLKVSCFECKNEIAHQKYFYLCITCKQKVTKSDENSAKKSINSQNKKLIEDLDLDHILCENCEEQHEGCHIVVQISKEDIMTMHTTTQQNAGLNIVPQQKTVNFQNSNLNSINNYIIPNGTYRQSEPRKSTFTQSMGGYNFHQSNTASKAYQTFFNNNPVLEQSTYFSNNPPIPQMQQQQSIIQLATNQEINQRKSIAELEEQNPQLLTKIRSKKDNKSQTTIVRKSVQQGDGFDYEQTQDDTQIPIQQGGGIGRHSTNQNAFKNQNIKNPLLIPQKADSITSNHQNYEEKLPTFNDPLKFLNSTSQDQTIIQAIENGKFKVSPVVSQLLGSGETLKEIDTPILPQKIDSLQLKQDSIKQEKNDINQEQESQNQKLLAQIGLIVKQQTQSEQVNQKISFSSDVNQEPQRVSIQGSSDLINGSMCVKSSYNSNASKLTQSSYLAPSRTSLANSMAGKPDDSRLQSQYRAKLVNSFCSSDILSDDSVIVFQEILNNGSENWPDIVYLKCISGITDNCQYPVIQVNKGEAMQIAFPIKIDQSKANDGEQIKTAWRLYYQQENEERKFFGPKITIDFIYKKSKKQDAEQTLEYLLQQSTSTIKNIFNKEEVSSIQQFVKQNQNIAEEYLADQNKDFTISKLIVTYIQQYVTLRNKKQQDEKQDQ